MDSKETYSAIKNYIHNELGITKEEIVSKLKDLEDKENRYDFN